MILVGFSGIGDRRSEWWAAGLLAETAFRQTECYDLCDDEKIHWRVSPYHNAKIEIYPQNETQRIKLLMMLD